MNHSLNRRQFITQTAAATGAWLVGVRARAQKLSPNDKLNIGMIGVANRAGADLQEVSTENIVALCDIDDNFLSAVKEKYPSAKTYNDFRRLLDQKGIDAVVVGTPDHTHAVVWHAEKGSNASSHAVGLHVVGIDGHLTVRGVG